MQSVFIGFFTTLILFGASQAQTPPPISAYTDENYITSVDISPNGERLAMLATTEDGRRLLLITNLGSEDRNAIAVPEDDTTVALDIGWVSDEFIAINFIGRRSMAYTGRGNIGATLIVSADGETSYTLPRFSSIVSILPADPDNILIQTTTVRDDRFTPRGRRGLEQGYSQTISLMRHNLRGNAQSVVDHGEADTFRFILNDESEPVLRQDFDDERNEIRIFGRQGGGWREVYSTPYTYEYFGRRGRRIVSDMGSMVGQAHMDGLVWFYQILDRNRTVASLYDIEENTVYPAEIDPQIVDISGFETDWRTNRVVGVNWEYDRPRTEYFVSPWGDIQAQLENLYPDSIIEIQGTDYDLNRFIIYREAGGVAGVYYLLDRQAGTLEIIANRRPQIPDEWVAEVQAVEYVTRDNRTLLAYLTLPPNTDGQDLPLVVMPHGGPQARDYYGFDDWAQIIASRGYAVIQPQFRGSDGFGLDFVRLGHGEWGRAMQADLIDAVEYLVGEQIVDENRVCIFGWSYGGYAALASATLDPESYRCVVAGAPVSDIFEMLSWSRREEGRAAFDYWTEYIGDIRDDRDALTPISPAQQASNVQAPIMLIHGDDDIIVPIEQSEIMARALDRAGKSYEFITIEDGPHVSVLMTEEHQRVLYENLLRFLQTHNPAD